MCYSLSRSSVPQYPLHVLGSRQSLDCDTFTAKKGNRKCAIRNLHPDGKRHTMYTIKFKLY